LIKYFLIIFFFTAAHGKDISYQCKFEEVHNNGEIHQGIILISDKKLRYEYFNENLYTLIHKENNLYLIRNSQNNFYEKIQKNKNLFDLIIKVSEDYPNFKKNYHEGDHTLIIEKNHKNNFLKRIGVITPQIKLSIYFNDCLHKDIEHKFFSFSPFFEYKI